MILPFAFALFCDCSISKRNRYIGAFIAVAAAIVSLATYFYCSRFYAPYFEQNLIATSLPERIISDLGGLPAENLECLTNTFQRLIKLKPRGIMVSTFLVCWILILIMFIKALKAHNRNRSVLLCSLLVTGFVIFETQMLIYTYLQMHRMLISVIVAYLFTIIMLCDLRIPYAKIPVRALVVVVIAVACCGALVHHRDDYALPQPSEVYASVDDLSLRLQLAELMPRAENEWDNTIARAMEKDNTWLYYDIPRHLTTNICRDDYLNKAIENDSFKSKYLCLTVLSDLNDAASTKYPLLYQDQTHRIYQVREFDN